MIEPQSVQAGESAVSNTTGAWPTASRSARSFASPFCATIFSPSSNPLLRGLSLRSLRPRGLRLCHLISCSLRTSGQRLCRRIRGSVRTNNPQPTVPDPSQTVVEPPGTAAGAALAERAASGACPEASPLTAFASVNVVCRLMIPTASFSSCDMNFVAMYRKM